METASLREREQRVVPLLRPEKRAHLIIHATKTGSRDAVFESAPGAVALFHPSVVLLQMVVQVAIRAVGDLLPKDVPHGARVGIVTIRRDAGGYHLRHWPRGANEGLRCYKIPRAAEAYVHQMSIPIYRPVELLPPPVNADRGLVHGPAIPDRAVPTFAPRVAQQRGQFPLPVPHGFMGQHDPPREKHLREIAKTPLVTETPQHHQRDDIRRLWQMLKRGTGPLVKPTFAGATAETAVA
jgi:hypothetical protein